MGTPADGLSPVSGTAILIATVVVSAVATHWAIGYARRRSLVDLPGQRRSHREPTARGGGIAIVLATLFGWASLILAGADAFAFEWLAPPIVLVAAVGWIDDHGGLSALARFAAHCVAAAWVFAVPLLGMLGADAPGGALLLAALTGTVVTLSIAWSINLHNFMDGIDGLLTLQVVFVCASLAGLSLWRGGEPFDVPLVVACACLGFLPYNFPKARVFMGDVGSGVLGLVVAACVLRQIGARPIAAASGLVLCSAFVVDASCTLASRMLRGRRWYSAHREHLYQWLVRRGRTHARVVAIYMGWNFLVCLPVVVWMNWIEMSPMPTGMHAALGVYALGVVAWCVGKRACLRGARARGGDASA